MEDKNVLIENIDQIHTTQMGAERIRRNLKIVEADPVEYCRKKISDRSSKIYRKGKNWYCETDGIRITIHSTSYTIITAHTLK